MYVYKFKPQQNNNTSENLKTRIDNASVFKSYGKAISPMTKIILSKELFGVVTVSMFVLSSYLIFNSLSVPTLADGQADNSQIEKVTQFKIYSTKAPVVSDIYRVKVETPKDKINSLKEPIAKTHIVVSGDTLESIALKNNIEINKIVSLNNLDMGTFLRIGQVLKVG